MAGHAIATDHVQEDGTEVLRCADCGLVYLDKTSFDRYACVSTATYLD